MGNRNKAAALIIILFLAFAIADINASASTTVKTVTIRVGGMTCKMCAALLLANHRSKESGIKSNERRFGRPGFIQEKKRVDQI